MRYRGLGPPQIWQEPILNGVGERNTPLSRLYLAGDKGLPVGRGARWLGGLREDSAWRLMDDGAAYLERDNKGNIIRAYARQYVFNFAQGHEK